MTVISIQRIRDGVLTSATETTLSIVNSAGVIILPTTIIAPVSAGTYSYETSILTPGNYTATWVFATTGLPTDTISRAFNVDDPVELTDGLTLMDLEAAIAARSGPWKRCHSGIGSTVDRIYCPDLKSSLNMGSYEDQFVLRRGLTRGLEVVTDFEEDDRIRRVAQYDPTLGHLYVDRSYAQAPVEDEALEILGLNPEDELRPAALAGLKRCFFWDTINITVTGSGVYNINLTSSMPWLSQVSWVRDVALSYPSQLLPPSRMGWWKPYREGRSIKLWTKGGAVGSVVVSALRPAHSLVNGELSMSGPDDDLDVVYVDLDYAAWAGVLELWKSAPAVLMPLTAQGMIPTREDAATEFTKKSLTLVQQMPDTIQIDFSKPDLVQIGNLAEPV